MRGRPFCRPTNQRGNTQANGSRVKALKESIGDVPLEAFRLEHAEHAMRQPPAGLSPTTRRHYAQIVRKVLQYCVCPLKVIDVNPVPTNFLPKIGAQKAHQWLYPAEDAALLACDAVPLHWRLFWGFLYREGLRCSEALALNVGDVDLHTGVLTLNKNKTNDPRAWALRPDVREALKRWVDQREAKPADPLFVGEDGKRLYDEHMARLFREHLAAAGVTEARPQLLERSEQREPIRAHDQRAAFVTLALAAGKSKRGSPTEPVTSPAPCSTATTARRDG